MLPRQRVVFLSGEDSREETIAKMQTSGYSRFPYSPTRDLDDATGIVLARQLLFHLNDHPEGAIDWSAVVREPLITPTTKPANELLRTIREAAEHMALVIDEYGGVEGVVTLEDVLEELVGEIFDESDRREQDVWRQSDGSLHVLASMDFRRLCGLLAVPWIPEPEATTIGGYITERLGHVPVVGDTVLWREFEVEVLAANPRQAELIGVRQRRDEINEGI